MKEASNVSSEYTRLKKEKIKGLNVNSCIYKVHGKYVYDHTDMFLTGKIN